MSLTISPVKAARSKSIDAVKRTCYCQRVYNKVKNDLRRLDVDNDVEWWVKPTNERAKRPKMSAMTLTKIFLPNFQVLISSCEHMLLQVPTRIKYRNWCLHFRIRMHASFIFFSGKFTPVGSLALHHKFRCMFVYFSCTSTPIMRKIAVCGTLQSSEPIMDAGSSVLCIDRSLCLLTGKTVPQSTARSMGTNAPMPTSYWVSNEHSVIHSTYIGLRQAFTSVAVIAEEKN